MDLRPVLYAEDEETDVFFLKRAFKNAVIANSLIAVPNGQEAIDYLSHAGSYSHAAGSPLPCLVLLDLNMPKKSGIEVLTWIRDQEALCTLPVVILSSSLQQADIRRSYIAGANAYLAKPSQPEKLISLVEAIKGFWLERNQICD